MDGGARPLEARPPTTPRTAVLQRPPRALEELLYQGQHVALQRMLPRPPAAAALGCVGVPETVACGLEGEKQRADAFCHAPAGR